MSYARGLNENSGVATFHFQWHCQLDIFTPEADDSSDD